MSGGLSGDCGAELRRVGSAHEDNTGGAKSGDKMIVARCCPSGIFQKRCAGVMGVAGAECMEVLEHERHTAERSVGKCSCCFGPGLFEPFVNDGIELRVQRLDAADGGVDQFQGRGLAAADTRSLGGGVEWSERI